MCGEWVQSIQKVGCHENQKKMQFPDTQRHKANKHSAALVSEITATAKIVSVVRLESSPESRSFGRKDDYAVDA